jgi:hypothetical protein
MHEWLVYTLLAQGEAMGARPNVPLLEEVASLILQVDHIDQDPQPYIKLAVIDK